MKLNKRNMKNKNRKENRNIKEKETQIFFKKEI